jgi:hypothetical protein
MNYKSNYMKKIAFIGLLLIMVFCTYGQIGINTNTPDQSAVLDISSNTKGLLIPRFTTVERTAYATTNPADGITVFDSQMGIFFVWKRKDETTGQWNYINPWQLNEIVKEMSLPSSIANKITIGGNLFVSNIDIKGNLTINGNAFLPNSVIETDILGKLIGATKKTAYNKNFGSGASDVEVGSNNPSQLKTIVYEIGSWDMYHADNKYIDMPTSFDGSKIIDMRVLIQDDSYNWKKLLNQSGSILAVMGTHTALLLERVPGGEFQNTTHSSTTINRGWIIFTMLP